MRRSSAKKRMIHRIAVLLIAALFASGFGFDINMYRAEAAESMPDINIGDHIYMGKRNVPGYTGLPYWRVIDKDSDGYLFLLSEYLWTGDYAEDFLKFNDVWAEGIPMEGYEEQGYLSKGSAWQGSFAQSWCKSFESDVLGNITGLEIKPVTKTDDEFPSPDDKDVIFAWTRNILDQDKVFFLSGEEVVHYFPDKSDRAAYLHDGYTVGEIKDWWLRSPRLYTTSECAGKVLAYGQYKGDVARQIVSSLGTYRPALWVKLNENANTYKCVHSGKTIWTVDPETSAPGYNDPVYQWSPDNKTCTAQTSCKVCSTAVIETAVASVSVEEATTESSGVATYTALFKNPVFKTQTKMLYIPKKTVPPQKEVLKMSLPKVTVKKPVRGKKSFTAKWKKLSSKNKKKVSGIQVEYALNKSFTNAPVIKAVKKSKASLKIRKLKSKKTYWVRIRTYKNAGGIRYVGKWSKAKKVKVK